MVVASGKGRALAKRLRSPEQDRSEEGLGAGLGGPGLAFGEGPRVLGGPAWASEGDDWAKA